jgi:serine phosphatase RsbU (regulator of sigma subunit)
MFRTIRWKLMFSISLPLLVTYLGMLAWDYYRQRNAAMAQMQQMVVERAENAAGHIDARLHAVAQLAQSMATLIENRQNPAEASARIQSGFRQNPWVAAITVAMEPQGRGGTGRPEGMVTRRTGGGMPRVAQLPPGVGQREWYVRAKESGAPAWTDPYDDVSPGGGGGGTGGDGESPRRACTYAVPMIVGEQFRGVVAVSIYVDELRQLRQRPPSPSMQQRPSGRGGRGDRRDRDEKNTSTRETSPAPAIEPLPPPPSPATRPSPVEAERAPEADFTQPLKDFAILNAGGHVIVAPVNAPQPPEQSIFELATKLGRHELGESARAALGGESRVVRVAGLHEMIGTVTTDTHHWIALAPIPTTGWALVTVIPESETMAPILARIAQRGAFLLGGTIVLLMVVMLVAIRISRPIEQMAGAVERLAAGDMDAHVNVTGRDELGRLAGGFNRMTRQLKSQVAALTEQTAAREKVESELRIARQIQTDMLPRTFPPFPDRPEFDLHAVNLPARRVAGDFYDFFFTPAGALVIVIADVSGKGVPAALLMAVTRTIVRNLGMSGLAPREMAERANAMLLADTSQGMFVTMLLCQYDPATGRLAYVNAGHPPPYRLAAGTVPKRCCDVQSPLLGVDASGAMGPFQQCEETLAPGESIFLYTDGVPDARAPDRASFGEGGLLEALRDRSALAPEPLARSIADHLDRFQSGQRQDDITLVVLRRST